MRIASPPQYVMNFKSALLVILRSVIKKHLNQKDPLNKSIHEIRHSGMIQTYTAENPVKTIIYMLPVYTGMMAKVLVRDFPEQY
jgi:hypothetical protein